MRREQTNVLNAICLLKNCFKRRFVQAMRGRYFIEKIHNNEVARMMRPLAQSKRMLVGTNWSCAYITNQEIVAQAPSLDLVCALRTHLPLPVLADREYTFKTMVSKLKLKPQALLAKVEQLRGDRALCTMLRDIFVVDSQP